VSEKAVRRAAEEDRLRSRGVPTISWKTTCMISKHNFVQKNKTYSKGNSEKFTLEGDNDSVKKVYCTVSETGTQVEQNKLLQDITCKLRG
jgi:hypothetical protein